MLINQHAQSVTERFSTFWLKNFVKRNQQKRLKLETISTIIAFVFNGVTAFNKKGKL